jgi:hypothetical protein
MQQGMRGFLGTRKRKKELEIRKINRRYTVKKG